MTNEQIIDRVIELVGSINNISSAENCMTRLRINLIDSSIVKMDELKNVETVSGVVADNNNLQIVFGPGKAKKMSDILNVHLNKAKECEKLENESKIYNGSLGDWKANKKKQKEKQKNGSVKRILKLIGQIFVPMIPALIASGIFNGFASIFTILMQQGAIPSNAFCNVVQLVFSLVGNSFIAYLAIYTGINAAKQFDATPVLGGMLGAMSLMTQVTNISQVLQNSTSVLHLPFAIYDFKDPLNSILIAGKGGIIGVIFGVWVLAYIEKFLRKRIPDTLELILTPLISMFLISIFFVLFIMPITGIVSDYLVKFLNLLLESSIPAVKILSGFVLSTVFLPMVMLGLHQGLIPIYTVQLQAMGYITLFPVLAMSGAGQVGAALSLYIKARKAGNTKLTRIITGALPAGFLGVGEPLIYGVTLPLGKPFVTAGIGAGFGGAWCMFMHVVSSSFGPSGLEAIPLMLPGSMLNFLIGLIISYIMGFIITHLFIRKEAVENKVSNT